MAFRRLFVDFKDKYLADAWNELNRRIAQATVGVVTPAYGQLYNGTPSLFSSEPAGVYPFTAFDTIGPSNNLTPAVPAGTLTIIDPGIYQVGYVLELDTTAAPNNVSIAIAIGGTPQARGRSRIACQTTTRHSFAGGALFPLGAGQVLGLRYEITVPAGASTEYATFWAARVA